MSDGPLLSIATYRLLFRHPFGTAHGVRTGTDSVFVRLTAHGRTGYGEATLPPYVLEKPADVIRNIRSIDIEALKNVVLEHDFDRCKMLAQGFGPGARTAFTSAYLDLTSNLLSVSVSTHFGWSHGYDRHPRAMVTLGHCEPAEVALKLGELPPAAILKVKLGGVQDEAMLREVMRLDDRPLLLDGNQGLADVDTVVRLVNGVGTERVVAVEQPFSAEDLESHRALGRAIPVPVIADESVQGIDALDRIAGSFGGVNIKLMKCGGLDRAWQLAEAARERGLVIMLGSMSETSLGCATMAALAPLADLVDLDGPWLIKNDPFTGLELDQGRLVVAGATGIGVQLSAAMDWRPIGA